MSYLAKFVYCALCTIAHNKDGHLRTVHNRLQHYSSAALASSLSQHHRHHDEQLNTTQGARTGAPSGISICRTLSQTHGQGKAARSHYNCGVFRLLYSRHITYRYSYRPPPSHRPWRSVSSSSPCSSDFSTHSNPRSTTSNISERDSVLSHWSRPETPTDPYLPVMLVSRHPVPALTLILI